MSPTAEARPTASRGFPRVSGDEPVENVLEIHQEAFSPRERG